MKAPQIADDMDLYKVTEVDINDARSELGVMEADCLDRNAIEMPFPLYDSEHFQVIQT